MGELAFTYEKISGNSTYELHDFLRYLNPEIKRVIEAQSITYDSPYSFLRLPDDEEMLTALCSAIHAKQQMHVDVLVLIGIGGSNLGTLAVHELINGTLYNNFSPKMLFYCADTIETLYSKDLLIVIESLLRAGKKVLITVVSKSGTTTETLANAALIYQLIARFHPHDAHKYVVIITDKGSSLEELASQHNYTLLIIPRGVGGRYSVLSPVGLFPLALVGVDIHALRDGARYALKQGASYDATNWAAMSAIILYKAMLGGCVIHDTFVFSPRGFSLGLWYRQLMAESLGKQRTYAGEPVNLGLTPTVSVGTTDLHSIGQLYLGGLRDKITTMISFGMEEQLPLPSNLFSHDTLLEHKSVGEVQKAIEQAVSVVYEERRIPYMKWFMPEKNAYAIGQFLYNKMVEIVYLGYLMKVNPFDQPEVELYKKETKRILEQ
jgi:glucose-6-phosphate isomerase